MTEKTYTNAEVTEILKADLDTLVDEMVEEHKDKMDLSQLPLAKQLAGAAFEQIINSVLGKIVPDYVHTQTEVDRCRDNLAQTFDQALRLGLANR
jgi:hypothetical protein